MKKGLTHLCVAGIALVLLACGSARGQATATNEDLKATLDAALKHIQDQDRRLAELEKKENDVEYAKKRQEEMRKVIKEIVDEAAKSGGPFGGPDWMKNLVFSGDFRLRYQGNFYNWSTTGDGRIKDRNRARFRLRFGFVKEWPDEDLSVGFRLATGEDSFPNSENQTFDGSYSKKQIWVDQAWAKWAPRQVQGLTLIGGKMPTPWVTNEIFFDNDINPEGFWLEYAVPKKCSPCIQPFIGAGYFILHDAADAHRTVAELYQVGLRTEVVKDVKYTLAGFFHQYEDYNLTGNNPRGNDNPLVTVPGFSDVGISNRLELPVCGRPLAFFADWAHNCQNKDAHAQYDDSSNAFAAGVKYGQNKKKGDWSVKYVYAYVEANSLPGTLCDDDFGYANRQGHIIGTEYNILDSLTAGAKVYITEPIFQPATTTPGKTNGAFEDITTTLMLEMLWKF